MRKSLILLPSLSRGALGRRAERAGGPGPERGRPGSGTSTIRAACPCGACRSPSPRTPRSAAPAPHHRRRGGFRFQGLFPGKFKVTAQAPKLRTYVQENLRVTQNSTGHRHRDGGRGRHRGGAHRRARAGGEPAQHQRGRELRRGVPRSLPWPRAPTRVSPPWPRGSPTGTATATRTRAGAFFSNKYTVDGFNTTDPVTRPRPELQLQRHGQRRGDHGPAGGRQLRHPGMVTNIVTKRDPTASSSTWAPATAITTSACSRTRATGAPTGACPATSTSAARSARQLWYYLSAEAWRGG